MYAFREEDRAYRFLNSLLERPLMRSAAMVNSVWGEVALWGDVIEHEDGYRAQSAYPRHCYVPLLLPHAHR